MRLGEHVETVFKTALDALNQGVILLDKQGSCVFANRVAREIIAKHNGIYIVRSRMFAVDSQESAKLQNLIKMVLKQSPKTVDGNGGVIVISRQGGDPLYVSISSFPSKASALSRDAVAIALIADPELQPRQRKKTLGMLYALTPAESEVAEMVARGLSVRDAAALNQVSIQTIRSQLKSIFRKTGVRRQGELIKLFNILPYPFWE